VIVSAIWMKLDPAKAREAEQDQRR